MDAFDSTTRGVVHILEGSIPLEGDGSGAGNAGLTGHTLGSRVTGEVLGENGTVIILLLVLRRIDGEALSSMGHLLVADSLSGNLFERIDP